MINPRHPEIANPRRKNSPSPGPVGMTTKKVQDYLIFMNDILGRGNFSQVYRGINTKTSTPNILVRLASRSQSRRTEQSQNSNPDKSATLRDLDSPYFEPPQRPTLLRHNLQRKQLLHSHRAV